MTAADYARARRLLARRDPVLRDLMRRYGKCGLADSQHTDPFKALVHAETVRWTKVIKDSGIKINT